MKKSRRTTDFGTAIIHAALLTSFVWLAATGLRIAADDPESMWLAALDPILPVENLWYNHLLGALSLIGALAAYVVYVRKARLAARSRLDRSRLVAMLAPGRARWSALNVVLFWILMAALAVEIVTGVLLYAAYGGSILPIHRIATYVAIASVTGHVGLHAAYGGLAQLLRIVRPAPLTIAPPPPDLAELLAAQLAKQAPAGTTVPLVPAAGETPAADPGTARPAPTKPSAPGATAGTIGNAPVPGTGATSRTAAGPARPATIAARVDQRGGPPSGQPITLMAHPLVTALAAAAVACAVAFGAEVGTRQTLHVVELIDTKAPVLDGDLSDPAWARAKPVTVLTTQGGDFGGTHESLVEIRAVHDNQYAYFAFVWQDPTRSLKHMPLVKRKGRWLIAAMREDLADETHYNEDKFSVLLTQPGLPLIGAAIHLARKPLAGHPPSSTRRGLHYTGGGIADIWLWRAAHEGPTGHIDNCHFGGPMPRLKADRDMTEHYAGGFAPDPDGPQHRSNMTEVKGPRGMIVKPRRLPRDLAAIARAIGPIHDGPGQSDMPTSRWWMTFGESVPYTDALDARIPDGTVIPSVVVPDTVEARPTLVRGTARWAAGRWTLEIVRQIHTGSRFDVPIKTGTLMWVAAFDHADKRHTRHLRPFRLEVD